MLILTHRIGETLIIELRNGETTKVPVTGLNANQVPSEPRHHQRYPYARKNCYSRIKGRVLAEVVTPQIQVHIAFAGYYRILICSFTSSNVSMLTASPDCVTPLTFVIGLTAYHSQPRITNHSLMSSARTCTSTIWN